jgi:predicted small integral membrane protein
MMIRLSKCILLMAVALYLSIVVFDNVADYDSNYQYVRHVLMMDTTFPGNHEM